MAPLMHNTQSTPALNPYLLWAITVSIIGAIIFVGWLQHYQNERDKAAITAQETAHAYAVMGRQMLLDFDRLVVRNTRAYLAAPESSDELQKLLNHYRQNDPRLLDLLILDAQGEIQIWSGQKSPPDVRDRAYFTQLAEGTLVRTITPPALSRVYEGVWFFALSHAVRDHQGALQAVGVALIDVAVLGAEFSQLFRGGLSSAALIHSSGEVVLSSPVHSPGWHKTQKTEITALEPLALFDLTVVGSTDIGPLQAKARELGILAAAIWALIALTGWLLVRNLTAHRQQSKQHHLLYRETLYRLNRISRNLPGMIFEYERRADGSGSFPYVSEGVKTLYNLKPQTLQQDAKALFDLIDPADCPAIRESLDRSAENLSLWHVEYRLPQAEGQPLWIEAHAIPQRQKNGTILWHGYHIDVTRRKRLEEQIKLLNENLREEVDTQLRQRLATERLYQAIFENSPEGVLLLDHEGRFIHANKAAGALLKVEPKELMGKRLSDISPPIQPETGLFSDIAVAQIQGRALKGHTEQFEWVCLDGDAQEVMLQILLAPFGEEQTEILAMWRDISEIKTLQNERQLQQAVLIQQSKLAELGNMIGAIAHQWKQPLNAIGLIAQEIADAQHHNELDKEETDRLVERIMKQVRFMGRTVDDFRNFYKPSLEDLPFEPKGEIEQIVQLLSSQLVRHNIALDMTAEEEIAVIGKPGEFRQVILNLINNAKEALIDRTVAHPRITVDLKKEGRHTIITVEDNGGGIPEHLLPHKLFEPFTSTKGDKGTGIGLSLAVTILERMHGSIEATNRRGGASFTIRLPLAPKENP